METTAARREVAGAAGHARAAGWLVTGGGAGLVLSACLPWFSVLGIEVQLPIGSFVMVGIAGSVVAYLGVRILRARDNRRLMAALWVLASFAALVAISLYQGAHDVQEQSYGLVSAAFGFDLGMLALVATIAGTVLLQISRRRRRATT